MGEGGGGVLSQGGLLTVGRERGRHALTHCTALETTYHQLHVLHAYG